MLSINTNLSSLIVQNSMKQSTNSLNQAIERMTTGAKINHAKDNAANYNIATNMTTKLGALQVAEDNALQGLEMINTTSETLGLIEDKLSRMRALSVQALNGTYGEKSLSAINSEAESLLNEITRLNDSATYNGIKLFNTGKKDVTNAGKELELNEQGFLQEVVRVDTSGMTKLSSVDPNATLAVGEYSISTPEELAQLAEMANAGLVEAGSTFTLANDIDLGGRSWIGIGRQAIPFTCSFNGNGYTVSNFTSSALFDITSSGVIIKNIRLSNIDTKNAGLCRNSSGAKIENCTIQNAKITSTGFAGGFTAWGYYTSISDCYFEGDIQSTGSTVGGIAANGCRSGLTNCVSKGNVSGLNNVGGIIGESVVMVKNCYTETNIRGTNKVGGIVGLANSGVLNSYFKGTVNGDSSVSGIAGYRNTGGTLIAQNCIVEGKISGDNDCGIFLGSSNQATQTISDCFYLSQITGDVALIGENSTNPLINIQDLAIPCDYTLQIGSSGDNKTSTVSCTTYIDFGQLNNVLSSGIESTDSIEKIEELIKIAELKQVELGTVQNRLTSVLEEISTQYENLVSSRSTLQDADIAEVSSEYIRQQILQQASATLLATANQSASIALSLI